MTHICCCSFVCNKVSNKKWVIDSGANHHMTKNESRLNNVVDVSKLDLRVDHPNGSSTKINNIGNMDLSELVTLFDIFVVDDFNANLLSVHKLCKIINVKLFLMNLTMLFRITVQGDCGESYESGGLYYLEGPYTSGRIPSLNKGTCVSKFTWQNRLGNPTIQSLNVLTFGFESLPPCDV